LHAYALEAWQVTTADIEVTSRCNLRCEWCFLDRYDADGLPTEVLIRLGEQLRNAGAIFVSFTGGEPFLRRDLEKVLRAYDDLGIACEVKTNATHLADGRIEQLASLPLFDLQVSMYGPDATTATFTHGRYSFDRVRETVRRLVAAGVPVSLSVLVGTHNIDRLDEVHDVVGELAPVYYNPYITPRRGGDGPAAGLRLNARELQEKLAPFLARIGQEEPSSRYRDCATDEVLCSAGRTQIAVGPDGTVAPCLELPWQMGNITDEPLAEVLAQRHALLQCLRPSAVPACRTCTVRDYCDSCVGVAISANGTMTEPWSHRCDLARFAARKKEVSP
jgi:radical SAM protein with 4Fe4S-binding SPASM domain